MCSFQVLPLEGANCENREGQFFLLPSNHFFPPLCPRIVILPGVVGNKSFHVCVWYGMLPPPPLYNDDDYGRPRAVAAARSSGIEGPRWSWFLLTGSFLSLLLLQGCLEKMDREKPAAPPPPPAATNTHSIHFSSSGRRRKTSFFLPLLSEETEESTKSDRTRKTRPRRRRRPLGRRRRRPLATTASTETLSSPIRPPLSLSFSPV